MSDILCRMEELLAEIREFSKKIVRLEKRIPDLEHTVWLATIRKRQKTVEAANERLAIAKEELTEIIMCRHVLVGELVFLQKLKSAPAEK